MLFGECSGPVKRLGRAPQDCGGLAHGPGQKLAARLHMTSCKGGMAFGPIERARRDRAYDRTRRSHGYSDSRRRPTRNARRKPYTGVTVLAECIRGEFDLISAEDDRVVWQLPPLRVLESRDPDQVVRIALAGELDLAVCDQLSSRLEQLRRDGAAVRLDLSRLEFMDSSAIHMLVTAMSRAASDGEPSLQIVPEVSHSVWKAIELAGIGPLLWPGREHVGCPGT
jgi:anti-anti-sigma factor